MRTAPGQARKLPENRFVTAATNSPKARSHVLAGIRPEAKLRALESPRRELIGRHGVEADLEQGALHPDRIASDRSIGDRRRRSLVGAKRGRGLEP